MENNITKKVENVDLVQEAIYLYWLAYGIDALYSFNLKKLFKEFAIENVCIDEETVVNELKKYYLDYKEEASKCAYSERDILEIDSLIRKYWDEKKENYFYRRNVLDLINGFEKKKLFLNDFEILQYLRKLEIQEEKSLFNIRWTEILEMIQETLQYEVILERYCFYYGLKYQDETNLRLLKNLLVQYGFSINDKKLYADLCKVFHNIENPVSMKEKLKISRRVQIRKKVVMKRESIFVNGYFRRRNGTLEYVKSYVRKK